MGKVNNANLKILTQPLCVAAQFKRLEPQSGLGADEKKNFAPSGVPWQDTTRETDGCFKRRGNST
jgi:hypothetical protein